MAEMKLFWTIKKGFKSDILEIRYTIFFNQICLQKHEYLAYIHNLFSEENFASLPLNSKKKKAELFDYT